jgi:hypothetical protein
MATLNSKLLQANQCTSLSELASVVEKLLQLLGDIGDDIDGQDGVLPVFFDADGGPGGDGGFVVPGSGADGTDDLPGACCPLDPNSFVEGCAILFEGEVDAVMVSVDTAQLAGNGISVGANGCSLDVDIDAGSCLTFDGGVLDLDIATLAGAGLGATGCTLNILVGCGLGIVNDKLQVDTGDLAGKGLAEGGECELDVKPGCGIKVSESDGVEVDLEAIAGDGLTSNTCDLEVNAGCGLQIGVVVADELEVDTSSLVSASDYLFDFGNCGLDVIHEGLEVMTGITNINLTALGAVLTLEIIWATADIEILEWNSSSTGNLSGTITGAVC